VRPQPSSKSLTGPAPLQRLVCALTAMFLIHTQTALPSKGFVYEKLPY
jgi:hypothetical protein